MKKSERDDIAARIGFLEGNQITPNMLDSAKPLASRYFDEKGYKNAEIVIIQRDDVTEPDKVILDVNVDKKEKVKVIYVVFLDPFQYSRWFLEFYALSLKLFVLILVKVNC